ncbi:hypothetical protein NEF87_004787 [Candidatus Lokiarchaeum ossiferum]|uniref:Roadblock/LAMTOR2 domain-containing protein n=1 Tax=Candidatus Lokiarchaeum ossiferum TaxID=2951803 RepID=A0ABY6I1Q1_9ARCH|nr:hypothetical protein NEF87_004787 [Candidatus Lokiarchaeum sp. B-35]
MLQIPDLIRDNELSNLLQELVRKYNRMANDRIYGLQIIDQDAKVLAVNHFFDNKYNYWDIAAIGAALYGISKQGKDFFANSDLNRASLIYNSTQFFCHYIGSIKTSEGRQRDLLLLSLASKDVKIGLIVHHMKKFAPLIKNLIEKNQRIQKEMQMSEAEFSEHIDKIKQQLFTSQSLGVD